MEDVRTLMRRVINLLQKRAGDTLRDPVADLLEVALNIDHPDQATAVDYLQVMLISGDRFPGLAQIVSEEALFASNRQKARPANELMAELDALQAEEDRLELALEILNLQNDERLRLVPEIVSLDETLPNLENYNHNLEELVDAAVQKATNILSGEGEGSNDH